MKTVSLSTMIVLTWSLGAPGCARAPAVEAGAPSPSPAFMSIGGFSTPESALYDAVTDQYLVSNISGDPFAVDHDGFISRVSPDGRVVALRFIDGARAEGGLSAPKGMAVVGRALYVADIDRVRIYDADSGAARGTVAIPGASLLNDVGAAPDGTVYVTDTGVRREGKEIVPTGTDAVYALREGQPTRRIAGGDLGRPNGVVWNDGKLEVVTLGSGEWITLSLAGAILGRVKLPHGMLDGVVALGSGDFLISSLEGSVVYRARAGAEPAVILSSRSPADIGYDPKRDRLLVPVTMEDRLLVAPVPH
jgi:hypothetical protein